jgi:hypothetical protein
MQKKYFSVTETNNLSREVNFFSNSQTRERFVQEIGEPQLK